MQAPRSPTIIEPAAAPPPSVTASAGAPSIAAIVVTWNRRDAVTAVLRAIGRQGYPLDRVDLVVVDNGSTDGTVDHLRGLFHPEAIVANPTPRAHEPSFQPPELNGARAPNALGLRSLTIAANGHNLGGCGGFNTGLAYVQRVLDAPGRAARPDYAWLVDDDVDLPPDALERLVSCAESDESIGVVGSRAVDFGDRRTTIETTIFFDPRRGRLGDTPPPGHPRAADHARWAAELGGTRGDRPFRGVRDVDVVPACSLLARWPAVRRVGMWDKRYFIYCDDADWCLRFARAGYRVVCNLDAVVYHTPWFEKLTPARLYYSQRNIVWLLQKVLPARRLKYATARWLASILGDCLAASFHRRLFHAEIIRRTAGDIVAGRGGKLDDEGPPRRSLAEVFRGCGALAPGASVAVFARRPEVFTWLAELRAELGAGLMPGEVEPRWVVVARRDADAASPPVAGDPPRIVYSKRLRSKLRRQAGFFVRPPAAALVFDQTNDFPLLRGRWTIHADRKWPSLAQAERDSPGRRLAFLSRWFGTACRAVVYAILVRPYRSADAYG